MSSSSIRASSEGPLEAGSNDPFIGVVTFSRVGHLGLFYKWSLDIHSEFLSWWLQTTWVLENALETMDWTTKLAWNSVSRTSTTWQHFYQAANRLTGLPVLICRKCKWQLVHPNIKGTGTTALNKHISSSRCLQGSAEHGQRNPTRQLTFEELPEVPVSVTSIKISINSDLLSPHV